MDARWYEYADDMAARETEGRREFSFSEWCASIADEEERREEAERTRFAATMEDDDDVCF